MVPCLPLLVLPYLAELHLVPLQVGDGLLRELEVALGLPLQLLDVAAALLLALPRVLHLVQLLLEAVLQLAQVVALVLAGLNLQKRGEKW